MSLDGVTLAGKLLLAIYAADTSVKEPRVRRALGITHAGLRKLKRRLKAKGLLTTCSFWTKADTKHTIHVSGLVVHPDGRHFVSAKSAGDFEQKVAPTLQMAESMSVVNAIVIRAEILDVKGFNATDKFLLAVYAQSPNDSNAQVMERLGLSRAGLKKARLRLLNLGALTKTSAGYRINVPGLVYLETPDGRHLVSEQEALENGQIVAPVVRKVITLDDIIGEWNRLYDSLTCEGDCAPAVLQWSAADCIKQLEKEVPASRERDHFLNFLKCRENIYFAGQFIFDHCRVKAERTKHFQTIGKATPDQLATFRDKAEGMLLAGIAPKKLLGNFGNGHQADAGTGNTNCPVEATHLCPAPMLP